MDILHNFEKSLKFKSRICAFEGKHVWGTSILKDDNDIYHAYFSYWDAIKGARAAYVINCKVGHAISKKINGPYEWAGNAYVGTGNKDDFDAWTIHSQSVKKIDGKYVMVYMATNGEDIGVSQEELSYAMREIEDAGEAFGSEGVDNGYGKKLDPIKHKKMSDAFRELTKKKRVGMAISNNPNGPFIKVSKEPIIDVGAPGEWDSLAVANPTIIKTPEGKYNIYYKALVMGSNGDNRKYGLAISNNLEGPYKKYAGNPIIDFESHGNNANLEDGHVFYLDNHYYILARDMGWFDHQKGILLESKDGIHFSDPIVAYNGVASYVVEKLYGVGREGRYERPQIYVDDNGIPRAFIGASTGGPNGNSSPSVFLIDKDILMKE